MAGTLVQSTIDRIGDFLQDSQYQSLMVNSASYNVRIMRERKARMPFLDSQTGLPQSPVRPPPLPRHRLPSQHTLGQLYRYPAQPWRRRHRSYLARQQQQWLQRKAVQEAEASEHTILTVENPAAGSGGDDLIDKEAFYYEESVGFLDDDDDDLDNEDDDYDDDTYSMRSSRKRRGGKHTTKRTKGGFRGGGRKRRDGGVVGAGPVRPVSEAEDIIAKPYECQRCSARYKTRQGLSYHLSHTHKADTTANSAPVASGVAVDVAPPLAVPTSTTPPTSDIQDSDRAATGDGSALERILKDVATADGSSQLPVSVLAASSGGGSSKKSSCRSRKNSNTSSTASSSASVSGAGDGASGAAADDPDSAAHIRPSKQNTFVATPNPYCDFCLGDSRFNKKTGGAEQMVSCSDCGRSGHPSCLQFTAKMMEAVARYRWQCIECKCCTLCGTAENDDQLLFCDDCDRGYHLYCVRPPLAEPPEGEWACRMCRHSE